MEQDNRWIYALNRSEEALQSFFNELHIQKELAKARCVEAKDMDEIRSAQARYDFIISLEGRINNVLAEAQRALGQEVN